MTKKIRQNKMHAVHNTFIHTFAARDNDGASRNSHGICCTDGTNGTWKLGAETGMVSITDTSAMKKILTGLTEPYCWCLKKLIFR